MIWDRKSNSLALAALLTAIIAFLLYRGDWGANPAVAHSAAPETPEVAPVVVKMKVHPKTAAKSATAKKPYVRGERLREKGEALGGGSEERTKAAAEK